MQIAFSLATPVDHDGRRFGVLFYSAGIATTLLLIQFEHVFHAAAEHSRDSAFEDQLLKWVVRVPNKGTIAVPKNEPKTEG